MFNYGIGGQEVPRDASEGVGEISQNRTLMVEKLTAEAPVRPEVIEGLKTVEEVFQHFKPDAEVEFSKEDGSTVSEKLRFQNLGDFGTKGITAQSGFLQDLNMQKDQSLKMVKQLKTNKLLKAVIEDKDAKQAYINALNALIQEIEDAK